MKKSVYRVLSLIVLFGSLVTLGGIQEVAAEVQINVNIVAPPPLQYVAPPDVVVIPSGISYVYMVPNYYGVYFYGGQWYRFYGGHWFRSPIYNGYWDYIEMSMVPQVIIAVPPEYIYYVPSGYYRINYHDLHSNWRAWDKGHHWHSYDWYTHEMRDDIRRDRYSHIEKDRRHHGDPKPQHHGGPKHYKQYGAKQPHRNDVPQYEQNGAQKPQHHDVQKHQQQGSPKSHHSDVPKNQKHAAQTPHSPADQKRQ